PYTGFLAQHTGSPPPAAGYRWSPALMSRDAWPRSQSGPRAATTTSPARSPPAWLPHPAPPATWSVPGPAGGGRDPPEAGPQRGRRLRSSVSVPCSSNSIARAYIVSDPVGASSGLSDRRFRPVGL